MSAEDEHRERLRREEELLRRSDEMRRLDEARRWLSDQDRERREAAVRDQERLNAELREGLLKQQKKDLAERLRLMEEEKKRAAVFKQSERLKREQRRKTEEKKRRDRYEEALTEATGRSSEQLTPQPKTISGSRRSRLDPNLGVLPKSRAKGAIKDGRPMSGTGCLVIWILPLVGALWTAWSWFR
jgi:hypothetical protein